MWTLSQILGAVAALGAVALLMYAFFRNRHTTNPIPWEGVSAGVAALAVVSTVLFQPPNPIEDASDDDAPDPQPTVTVTATRQPAEPVEVAWRAPQNGEIVKNCVDLAGTLSRPLGRDEAIIIGDRNRKENRWYFEYTVHLADGRRAWNASMTLGSHDDKERGIYDLVAIVMPKSTATYLASTNLEGDTYWSSPELPDDVHASQQVSVTREFLKPRC